LGEIEIHAEPGRRSTRAARRGAPGAAPVTREAHFLIAPFEGAIRHYGHIMGHLQRQGYEVHLWTMEPIAPALVAALVPGLTCHRLPLVRGDHRVLDALRTVARAAALAVRHPDAVFSSWSVQTNLLCGVPLRALGRRCVFILAGMGSVFSSDAPHLRIARQLVIPIYRWLLRGPQSRVIVQNRDDLHFVTEVLGVPSQRVQLMHGCGIDPADFPFCDRLSERRPRVVLVPARLIREKGIFEAAEASRLLCERGVEHELWFTYDLDPGNPHSLTRAEVDALPSTSPAIRVLGRQPAIRPLLDAAHVVCLPTYREGLPTALLEAAAYGRPIVTTDVIGPRDIVRHEHNGLLVPVRDPRALADALERVLRDDALADRLRRNAHHDYLQRGTRDATLAQALPAYHSLGVPDRPAHRPREAPIALASTPAGSSPSA
jgi:glycosyltransferase involved in cell wall biosynthesis